MFFFGMRHATDLMLVLDGAWIEKNFRNFKHIFADWMLKSLGDQSHQQVTGPVATEGSQTWGMYEGLWGY